MNRLKFQHVWAFLLLIAAISAFVVQPRFGNRIKGLFHGLVMPVSAPTGALASWVRQRLDRPEPPRVLSPDGQVMREEDVFRENEVLRLTLASMTGQLEELRRRNAERELVGVVRPYCTPLRVVGGDSGLRQSLLVSTRGVEGLMPGQPVLYAHGIAGRIETIGPVTAQVKLITDAGFRVSGSFRRFVQDAAGRPDSVLLETAQPPLVEGDGKGRMFIRNIDRKEIERIDLRAGDWVVLNDAGPDWPLILQGYKLGEVVRIGQLTAQPLYAEVEVRPKGNLMQLREVMVMNRRE